MSDPIPFQTPIDVGAADPFRLVVEAMPHAIVLADALGRIVLVNTGAERLFGYTRAELIGQLVEMLVPERFRAVHRGQREAYAGHADARRLSMERHLFGLRKDAVEVPVEIGLDPVETPAGKFVLSTIIDITERLRAKAAMMASELRYRRLFESAKDGILILDAETGMVVDVNPFLETLLGFTHGQFLGKAVWELGFFKDVVANAEKFGELREKKYVRYEDLPLETSDGRRIEVEFVSNVYLVSGSRVIQCNVRDITERKQIEKALRVSEARFAAIFRSNPAAIGLHTVSTGRIVDVNERLCEFSGWTHEEIVGKTILELGTWVDPAQRDEVIERVRTTGSARDVEAQLRRRNGELRDVHLSMERMDVPSETEPVAVTIFTDLTERKRSEAQLKLLETCVARLNDIVLITEAEPMEEPGPRILFVNDAFVRRTGYTREEVIGRSPRFLQGPKTCRAELDRLHAAMRVWKPVRVELINYTKSGAEFWIELDIVPVADATGWFTHWVAVERDITERKRNEDRFRRLVDCNAQGVVFWKTNGEITGANDAFLHLVGYRREELEAGHLNWITMTPPEHAEIDRHCLEVVATKGVCPPYEKEYLRADGMHVPVLIGAAGFDDNPEEGVCFVVDLTERKRLEHQFLRAQRMESIGTLAGGIAHDLNNVLSPIMMSLAVLEIRFPDPESRELLAIISASAQRGADMVRQVLSFARGVEGRRMEVQVRHIVRDIEKIANDTFLKHIEVRANIPFDLWTVLGDPTQLHQVLLNLCVNARDAMPNGGTMTIAAENLTFDAHYASLNLEAKAGPYVCVQVEDNGTGMPPGIVEKIFDPFFTTKEVGKGTGLGLSTSLGIVKSHGGFIRVYSEQGRGTTFKIYLPAQIESSLAAQVAAEAEMPRGHGQLILVVDDEISVRLITQQTLIAFGYRVVLASDGAEAVAVYAKQAAEIAVVLTDMTMPVMDGAVTIQVLKKMNPKVVIVAASGLSAGGHAAQAARLGVEHFLPKPYTAEALLKVLQQVLAREA